MSVAWAPGVRTKAKHAFERLHFALSALSTLVPKIFSSFSDAPSSPLKEKPCASLVEFLLTSVRDLCTGLRLAIGKLA